jgi:hypothetical protein
MWACADVEAEVGGGKGLMSVAPSAAPSPFAKGRPSGVRSVLAALYVWFCAPRGRDTVDMVCERNVVQSSWMADGCRSSECPRVLAGWRALGNCSDDGGAREQSQGRKVVGASTRPGPVDHRQASSQQSTKHELVYEQ